MKAGAPRDEDTNVGSVRSSPAVQSMPSWGAHTRQGPPVDHVADRSGMRHVAGNDTPKPASVRCDHSPAWTAVGLRRLCFARNQGAAMEFLTRSSLGWRPRPNG